MCLSYIYLKLYRKQDNSRKASEVSLNIAASTPCFLLCRKPFLRMCLFGPHVLCSGARPEVDDQPKARVCRKNRSQASMPQRTR